MSITLYTLCGSDEARPFSPHVWKVVMALHHKGLTFDAVPTRFTAIPAIEGGATKTLPLLRDGDRLVSDSFAIADYLEDTYSARPSLFGGPGGRAACRLIEAYSQTMLHASISRIAVKDIFDMLDPEDQAYFGPSREARLGKSLDEIVASRTTEVDILRAKLEPLRVMLGRQPFVGGERPLFGDYILFGALQWLRVTATVSVLEEGDPVTAWFGRCLDLHGGIGRMVPARAVAAS
nr:glutathione S-transferase family protein [uncultured Gellertiella sp.]